MLYEKASRLSPSELEERLREVAPKHKFGVLNVLDLAGTLRAKGIDIGSEVKVLDICHPHSAADALKTNLATATVLPCRIAVYQTAEGSRVATVMPSDLFAATGLQGNQTLVHDVEQALIAIIDESC